MDRPAPVDRGIPANSAAPQPHPVAAAGACPSRSNRCQSKHATAGPCLGPPWQAQTRSPLLTRKPPQRPANANWPGSRLTLIAAPFLVAAIRAAPVPLLLAGHRTGKRKCLEVMVFITPRYGAAGAPMGPETSAI